MATLKVYPSIVRGYYKQDASYANVLSATSATGIWSSSGGDNGQAYTGSLYRAWQAFIKFDITPLKNIGTINSAKFVTDSTSDTSATDFTSNVRKLTWGSSDPANTDWQTPAELTSLPLLAHYDTSGGFSGSKDYVTDSLLSHIGTDDELTTVVSSSRFESSTTPTGNEYIRLLYPQFYIEVDYEPSAYGDTLVLIPPTADDSGYIRSSGYNNYAVARSGSALVAFTSSTILNYIGQGIEDFKGDITYNVYQTLVRFDTSGLSGATLLSAELEYFVRFDFSTTNFEAQARLHTWGSSLTTADWVAGADLSSKTLLAHLDTSTLPGTIAPQAYYPFTSDALLANINTSGYTDIILVSKEQVDNSAPTANENIANNSTNRGFPIKLTVTYDYIEPPEPEVSNKRFLTLLGVG